MPLNGFNYNVSWADFIEMPTRPPGVSEDAEINCHYPYSYDLGRNKKAIIVSAAKVDISTIAARCWVVTSKKTDLLLKHEQGHYDILALAAREFYNKLLALSATDEDKMKTKISDLSAKIQAKVKKINLRYDDKTNHHLDTAVQQAWDKQIAVEMQKPDGSIDNLPQ